MCCTTELFPFNRLIDDDEFKENLYDSTGGHLTLNRLREGPRLELYSDTSDNRPLLNNCDLDPDDNYFTVRPNDSRYKTPTSIEALCSGNKELLCLMHINCRSIAAKLLSIENLLIQLSVDILAVTETWLDETNAKATHIQGYNFEFQCRKEGRGGGVGFFIKKQINYDRNDALTEALSHHTYESLFLRFPQTNGSYFTTGVLYRPPGQDLEEFNNECSQLLCNLSLKDKDTYILGDFNIDLLKTNNHTLTSNFMDIMTSHHFLPVITQPTRVTTTTATLIDNIFSNRTTKIIDSVIIIDDISDHLPIMAWVELKPKVNRDPITRLTRNIDDASKQHFSMLLAQTDWSCIVDQDTNTDPDTAYNNFFPCLKSAMTLPFH
jgi:exonuclease III